MLSQAPPWPDLGGHGEWCASVLSWADDQYGPVRSLGGVRMAHPEPAYWVFAGDFTRTPVGNWFGGYPTGAAGASIDADEALLRCLGEVAERYSAMTAPVDGTLRWVSPELMRKLPRCAADENCSPVLRGKVPETPVTHVPVTRLADGVNVEIPAGYVHLTFHSRSEPVMTTSISSGLAFDPSLVRALWRGICEVAERDALMLTWWQRRSAAEIDLGCGIGNRPGLSSRLADRLTRVSAASLSARFFDITTDFAVPAVMCVLTSDRFPYLTVGAACHADAASACAKALDEAVAIRLAVRAWEAFSPPSLEDFAWLDDLEGHARLYAAGHLLHAFDFLLSGDQSPVSLAEMAERPNLPPPDTMADLRDIANGLERTGLTVLWTDLTAPELLSNGVVVKVVIPEMVPLSGLHSVRWLSTERMRHPGDDAEPLAASFNPYPHPFA